MTRRRRVAVGAATALVLVACGSGDDDGGDATLVPAPDPVSATALDVDEPVGDDRAEDPGARVGGFGDNPAIPGPDGTVTRESIVLTVDGDVATLAVDVAYTSAVEYLDGEPVCFDDFTYTSGRSELTVDGSSVSGTTELILDFDGTTRCPSNVQDDIGVPVTVDVAGDVDGATFRGRISIDGFSIPLTATVAD